MCVASQFILPLHLIKGSLTKLKSAALSGTLFSGICPVVQEHHLLTLLNSHLEIYTQFLPKIQPLGTINFILQICAVEPL